MSRKPQLLSHLLVPGVLLLFPIVALILMAFPGETMALAGDFTLITGTLMLLVGVLYYFGYEVLDGFFGGLCRVVGIVLNILAIPFALLIAYSGAEFLYETLHLFGPNSFGISCLGALIFSPLLHLLFCRAMYKFTDEMHYIGSTALMLVHVLFPIACYLVTVIAMLISPLIVFLAVVVIVTLVGCYVYGAVSRLTLLIIRAAFHIGVMVLGIQLVTNHTAVLVETYGRGIDTALILGAVVFGVGLLPHIGYSICNEIGFFRVGFAGLGGLATLVMTITSVVTLFGLNVGGFESGVAFGEALKLALYLFPLCFGILNYLLCMLGGKGEWEGLMDLTCMLITPILAYVLTVVMLLISFVYVLITLAILAVLYLVAEWREWTDTPTPELVPSDEGRLSRMNLEGDSYGNKLERALEMVVESYRANAGYHFPYGSVDLSGISLRRTAVSHKLGGYSSVSYSLEGNVKFKTEGARSAAIKAIMAELEQAARDYRSQYNGPIAHISDNTKK